MTTAVELDNHVELHLEQLSVDQYHAMLQAGILEEGAPVELLNGLLVRKDRRDGDGTGQWKPMPDSSRPGHFLTYDRNHLLSFHPLTVEQYHAMIEAGILPEGEPIELLNGLLVRKDRRDKTGDIMTIGPRHATAISLLLQMLTQKFSRQTAFVRCQLPITLRRNEPEPDLAVVLGKMDEFRERHPTPFDLALVVEVSDHSLSIDRNYKQEIYAEAGIREYWIVNLADNLIEIYQDPQPDTQTYARRSEVHPGELVSLDISGQMYSFDAADVLV